MSWAFVLLFFDIFNRFITGFYDKGVIIRDKESIALYYLKGWFFYDIIGLIPIICGNIYDI
jgi:hypothetical protein